MPGEENDSAAKLLLRHLTAPEVSVLDYLKERTASVGKSIESLHKLYLDTRYWIFLRDAALGRARRLEHETILELLRELVHKKIAICPVSDVAFLELTAQNDDETRAATAGLWDELSLGVALLAEEYRVRCELENFFRCPADNSARESLRSQVWTKACYVLGPMVPTSQGVPADELRAIQKTSVDALWELTFRDLSKDSSAQLAASTRFNEAAQKINFPSLRFKPPALAGQL